MNSRIILAFVICLSLITPQTWARGKKDAGHLWEYKRQHFNMYSMQDEIKLGTQAQDEQQRNFKKKKIAIDPPQHAALKSRIQNIVNRIAKVSDMPFLPFEVHIYDKPKVVNAYCMPGGKIGVFTGLFDKEKGLVNPNSDDEIAAVLSHEIAHATMRHVTRQITTYQGVGFLGGLISLGIGAGAGRQAESVFANVFQTGTGLLMPGYTRAHEKEADRVGFYYMTLAGFDPQAAINIWDRAAKRKKEKGKSDKTSFFDSHPANGDRANYLRGFLGDIETVRAQQKSKTDLHNSMR